VGFNEYFADALVRLEELVRDGLLEIHPDSLVLLPQGQLMMRNVAMAFDAYLGVDQTVQYSRTV
jgi:oxygen-independent coproporphyrinogen-3 oxidase